MTEIDAYQWVAFALVAYMLGWLMGHRAARRKGGGNG